MEEDERKSVLVLSTKISPISFLRRSRGWNISQRKLKDEFSSSRSVWCRTEFTNIFGENKNGKNVKNIFGAAPFD